MVRMEGLVKGGAAGSYEGCFMEHLRILKDPLLDQMVDRCGPAGRQTAQTQHNASCMWNCMICAAQALLRQMKVLHAMLVIVQACAGEPQRRLGLCLPTDIAEV